MLWPLAHRGPEQRSRDEKNWVIDELSYLFLPLRFILMTHLCGCCYEKCMAVEYRFLLVQISFFRMFLHAHLTLIWAKYTYTLGNVRYDVDFHVRLLRVTLWVCMGSNAWSDQRHANGKTGIRLMCRDGCALSLCLFTHDELGEGGRGVSEGVGKGRIKRGMHSSVNVCLIVF